MNKTRGDCRIALYLLLMVVVIAVASCGSTPQRQQEASSVMTIEAATDVLPLIQEMADTFAHSRPGLHVQVNELADRGDLSRVRTGVVSATVVTEVLSKTQGVVQTEIARQPIAVIIHSDNPVKALSLDRLRDIYNGRVTDWSELGGPSMPIMVLSRDRTATTRSRIDYSLIGSDGRLTPHALLLPSDVAMALTVSRRPEAIGYVAGASSPAGTKSIVIDGESPASVARGRSYPLWQPVVVVTQEPPPQDVESFLTYVNSKQGQRITAMWGCGQGAGRQ